MFSTLLAENSPSFPFQLRDLAQGHLMCAEPDPCASVLSLCSINMGPNFLISGFIFS